MYGINKKLEEIKKCVYIKKGDLHSLSCDLNVLQEKLYFFQKELASIEEAQKIIQSVSIEIQKQIKYNIENIINSAIESIFEKKYIFKLEFVVRRNTTEIDILLESNEGVIETPVNSIGGGLIDIISISLRLAFWALFAKKKNNTIILDEPFKFLSKSFQSKAGEMIKKVSEMLGLQLIIITHIPDIIDCANVVYTVEQIEGNSIIS